MKLDDIIQTHHSMQLEEAINAYHQYLDTHPNDPHAHELLAIAYAQNKQYDLALPIFQELYQQHPQRYSLLNNIATCYKSLKQDALAIQSWHKLLQMKPMPTAYNNLASYYLTSGDYHRANNLLCKALSLLPNYADAWFNRGLVSLKLEHHEDAISALEHSANLGHKKAMYQLGVIHEQRQDYPMAKSRLMAAIEENPTYALAHHALARVFLATGDDEKALEHFIEAQRINPHIPYLMENIAKYFHVKGQYANAIEYWSKVPPHDSDPEEIRYNIGVSYHFMGRHADAKTHLHAVLKHNPDHIDSHLNLAAIALQACEQEQAILHYQHVNKLEPDRDDVRYLLSALLNTEHNEHPPQAYIKNLFDQYAHYYERHLKNMLRYQVPEEINLMLSQHLNSPAHHALDLGCGSGIMGPIIKTYAKQVIGIDLSQNMLEEAAKKNTYDQLIESDCIAYLETAEAVDLVIAADLLPYLADPTPLFDRLRQALSANAVFIFSFESCSDGRFKLTNHARFQHNPDWIQEQLVQLGFAILEAHETTLRYNQNKPVNGTIMTAQRLS